MVSAYACCPYRGSEPGVGWNWVKAMSRYHDLWVITEENEFKADIEAELKKNPAIGERIHFYYIPRTYHRYLAKIWPPYNYWSYKKWQKKAFQLACSLHEEVDFDLAHQLNMIGYREPGYLWKLPLPFIWGPIGGFVQTPWSYMRIIGWNNAVFYTARNIINAFQMRFSIRVKTAMNHASALIASTIVDQKAIQNIFSKKSVLISEIGVPDHTKRQSREYYDNTKILKICWCGRIIGGKCLPIALYALSKLRKELRFELDVIGDGSERKRCVALSKKFGIDHAVNWHGWTKHEEAIKIMSQSDVMLITSIQDSTSSVVLEALNLGVPVICHDLCGFGNVVNDKCGIKISAKGPRKSVAGFSKAIERLMENPAIIQDLSDGAIKRASEFTWDHKMEGVISIYKGILPKDLVKN